jgi:hypothetical protein
MCGHLQTNSKNYLKGSTVILISSYIPVLRVTCSAQIIEEQLNILTLARMQMLAFRLTAHFVAVLTILLITVYQDLLSDE